MAEKTPKVYASGAAKRKSAKEKEKGFLVIQSKIKKINTYFPNKVAETSCTVTSASCEAESEERQEVIESTSATPEVCVKGPKCKKVTNDISEWSTVLDQDSIKFWVMQGSEALQNKNVDFKSGINDDRCCTKKMFSYQKPNGELVDREWLCYSPITKKLYCFQCKLFRFGQGPFTDEGFSYWKNASRSLHLHETSNTHCQSTIKLVAAKSKSKIDATMSETKASQHIYWQQLLMRITDVIKFIAERGKPFRGKVEKLSNVQNGNYLGLLELLAKYDSFLDNHMKRFVGRGSGSTSYLSHIICDELINIIGQEILDTILKRVKHSKYFSVSVDSTPDSSNTDQLTVILRYIENESPVERFLTFLHIRSHTGSSLARELLLFLEKCGIEFSNCRGQSHDNAPNMSGRMNGMQAFIKKVNPLAIYIPCTAHALNLVGQSAVDACPGVVYFFSFIQKLYNFFSKSTARWDLLRDKLQKHGIVMPKDLSDTRWSARVDAIKAVYTGYKYIIEVLTIISEATLSYSGDIRCTAVGLLRLMNQLEIACFTVIWHSILVRFKLTSQKLQSQEIDLNQSVVLYDSLISFVESLRNQFDIFENSAKELSDSDTYAFEYLHRTQKHKITSSELSSKDIFRTKDFLPILDKLIVELTSRKKMYDEASSKFGFISDLNTLSDSKIRTAANQLLEMYSNDLEINLGDELIHFKHLMTSFHIDNEKSRALEMYKIIKTNNLDVTFPNVEILLRIYLTLMVTNCSGERSFSKLKYLKNTLRSSLVQEKLNMLSLMYIESDILREIDMHSIIDKFAASKCRKTDRFT